MNYQLFFERRFTSPSYISISNLEDQYFDYVFVYIKSSNSKLYVSLIYKIYVLMKFAESEYEQNAFNNLTNKVILKYLPKFFHSSSSLIDSFKINLQMKNILLLIKQ
jgi:hypothetical protein